MNRPPGPGDPRAREPGRDLERVLGPLRSGGWLSELRRKGIHLAFVVLPLELLHGWLPWPRETAEWRVVLTALVVGALGLDLVRLHDRRVGRLFGRFFGEMIRAHEQSSLLGSTYLLLAALIAVEAFPRPVAAAAIGFTVLGDGFAAIVGRAYGRKRWFGKSLEGAGAGLLACLAWAAYLAAGGHLAWGTALVGALVASLVEFLPIPLDDNLGITMFAGLAMNLVGGSA